MLLLVVACIACAGGSARAFTPSVFKAIDYMQRGAQKRISPDDKKFYQVYRYLDSPANGGNGDGHINYIEMKNFWKSFRHRHLLWHMENIKNMRDIDTDGSGFIDHTEMTDYGLRYQLSDEEEILLLKRWDLDHDDILGAGEIAAMIEDTMSHEDLAGQGARYHGLYNLQMYDLNGDGRVSPNEMGSRRLDEGDDRYMEPDPEDHWLQICRTGHNGLKNHYPQYDPDDPDTEYHPNKCDKEQGREMFKLFDMDDSGYMDHHEFTAFEEAKFHHHRHKHMHFGSFEFIDFNDHHGGGKDLHFTIDQEGHTPDGVMRPEHRAFIDSPVGMPWKTMFMDYYDNHMDDSFKMHHEDQNYGKGGVHWSEHEKPDLYPDWEGKTPMDFGRDAIQKMKDEA